MDCEFWVHGNVICQLVPPQGSSLLCFFFMLKISFYRKRTIITSLNCVFANICMGQHLPYNHRFPHIHSSSYLDIGFLVIASSATAASLISHGLNVKARNLKLCLAVDYQCSLSSLIYILSFAAHFSSNTFDSPQALLVKGTTFVKWFYLLLKESAVTNMSCKSSWENASFSFIIKMIKTKLLRMITTKMPPTAGRDRCIICLWCHEMFKIKCTW